MMSRKTNQHGYQDVLEFQNGDWCRVKKNRCVEKLRRIFKILHACKAQQWNVDARARVARALFKILTS